MSDRSASMNMAKRRINNEKRERLTAVIAQIKDQGQPPEWLLRVGDWDPRFSSRNPADRDALHILAA